MTFPMFTSKTLRCCIKTKACILLTNHITIEMSVWKSAPVYGEINGWEMVCFIADCVYYKEYLCITNRVVHQVSKNKSFHPR
jgi:hypothetical protein